MNFVFTLILIILYCGILPQNTLADENSFNDTKIIGGSDAGDGQYPYQVSLRTTTNLHFCGGSIISRNFILTAAHCIYGENPTRVIAVVGTNYLNSDGTPYGVLSFIIHPLYNPQNYLNDIGVLLLRGLISYGSKVQPIDIDISAPIVGAQAVLIGWGLTSYPSEALPNNLQHIALKVIDIHECQNAFPGYPVYSSNVCTYSGFGFGSCRGDSGGPLVLNGKQIGIVSWGIPCAVGNPDVYTLTASFINWLVTLILI